MPRERAKLTDKQERILVQCQLMGLTPRDMTQISNRLVALERERQLKADISEATQGMTWSKLGAKGWRVVDSDGRIYECHKAKPGKRHQSYWDQQISAWDVYISGPDKRFKSNLAKGVSVSVDYGVTAKLCPENSKDLYAILKGIRSGRIR